MLKRTCVAIVGAVMIVGAGPRASVAPTAKAVPHIPTMSQFMSAAFPMELVAARKADRIAWIANDRGLRNVYTAAAPEFLPVRVTSYMHDDGVETTQLSISDDGSTVTFTRGSAPNRDGWIASPEADPNAVERAIWAAKTSGGASWRLAEGSTGVLSPDGRHAAFAKDGQNFRVPTAQAPRASDVDKGL